MLIPRRRINRRLGMGGTWCRQLEKGKFWCYLNCMSIYLFKAFESDGYGEGRGE